MSLQHHLAVRPLEAQRAPICTDRAGRTEVVQSVVDLMPRLRRFAVGLTRNSALADDLLQETLLRALSHLHQFCPGTNLVGWLHQIMRNTNISLAKQRRRETAITPGIEGADLAVGAPQPWELAKKEMAAAIDRLSPAHRETIELIAILGVSYEQCAEICGCEMGTVKSRLSRARHLLAKDLGEDEYLALHPQRH